MLPTLAMQAVQVDPADPIRANATIGPVDSHVTQSGYLHIVIPLLYNSEEPDSTDEAAVPSVFTARINVKSEWFDADYVRTLKETDLNGEYVQYKINFAGIVRSLFKALGLDTIDFSQIEGRRVRFVAKGSKKEPDRLQISGFYPEKQ